MFAEAHDGTPGRGQKGAHRNTDADRHDHGQETCFEGHQAGYQTCDQGYGAENITDYDNVFVKLFHKDKRTQLTKILIHFDENSK